MDSLCRQSYAVCGVRGRVSAPGDVGGGGAEVAKLEQGHPGAAALCLGCSSCHELQLRALCIRPHPSSLHSSIHRIIHQ